MIPSKIHNANRDARVGDLSFDCLDVAPLLAIEGELGQEDEAILVSHLALCRRCRSVFGQQASSTAAVVSPPRFNRTLGAGIGGLLVVAAVITIVVLRGAGAADDLSADAENHASEQVDASSAGTSVGGDASFTGPREAPKPASGRALEPPSTSNSKSPMRRRSRHDPLKPESPDATRRKKPEGTTPAPTVDFDDPARKLKQHCGGEVADEQVAQCFLFACAANDDGEARRFLGRIDGDARRLKLKKVCSSLRANRP